MRTLPPGLAATLSPGGAGRLATCWILARRDGARLGFTDHDQPLTLNDVACTAATGMTAGAAEAELGAKPGTAALQGVLNCGAIREADIAAGLYDRCAVEAWRLDWGAPSQAMLLWRGTIARITRDGNGYVAEVEGPLAALQYVCGRTYQRSCDAVLGDARCQVNLALPAYAGQVCDKSWRTCLNAFSNLINFQGFPDIPGDDFLTVYGTDSPSNTGGSRRTT